MKQKILEILENDCNTPLEQIALMTDSTPVAVAAQIDEMKNEKIILKNKAVINWEKTNKEFVTALIELKVTPQRGEGFDKIAERIYKFPEVKSLYLMAGAFDLTVIIEGKTGLKLFKEWNFDNLPSFELNKDYILGGAYPKEDVSISDKYDANKNGKAILMANRLAPMDSVISTGTHFVLKKYKDEGIIFEDDEKDARQVISL